MRTPLTPPPSHLPLLTSSYTVPLYCGIFLHTHIQAVSGTDYTYVHSLTGKTLEEISTMVEQLTEKIAEKKTVLAPMIRDLRSLQTQARAIEVGQIGRSQ